MAQPLSLLRADDGATVVEKLHSATNIWTRFVGLQFRRNFPDGHGLLIVPCRSIHTMFVRFAIDVCFLSQEGIVVEIQKSVRPWKILFPQQPAYAVLEMSAGQAKMEQGTELQVNVPHTSLPRALRFLASHSSQSEESP